MFIRVLKSYTGLLRVAEATIVLQRLVSALNIYFHFLFIILFVKCFFSMFTIYPFISNIFV